MADVVDFEEAWEGMPEFENTPKATRSLLVHFETDEDVESFCTLIDQSITDKTKYIWYPKKERQNPGSMVWDNES